MKIKRRPCFIPYPKTKGNCDISVFSENDTVLILSCSPPLPHRLFPSNTWKEVKYAALSPCVVSQALQEKITPSVALPSVSALFFSSRNMKPFVISPQRTLSSPRNINHCSLPLFTFFLPLTPSCFPIPNKGFLLMCLFFLCSLAGLPCAQDPEKRAENGVFPSLSDAPFESSTRGGRTALISPFRKFSLEAWLPVSVSSLSSEGIQPSWCSCLAVDCGREGWGSEDWSLCCLTWLHIPWRM